MNGRPLALLAAATALCVWSACRTPNSSGHELLLFNGVVWTGERLAAGAGAPTAVAVTGGRVVSVGSNAEAAAALGPNAVRIDLGGRRVTPGFMDSHTHFIEGGFGLAGVQLRDAGSLQEFARRIGAFAREHPGEWMTGGAWDHELWGGELPHRRWIDSVTPGTPVFVSRLDGHMALANSLALERAGVTAATADPPGGTIVRDANGPTGVLKDAAMQFVADVMPVPTPEARDRALAAAQAHALARGVTWVTDMGTWDALETYRRAEREGRLSIRVYSVVPLADWERMAGLVQREGRGSDRVRWGGVKAFVDGSLGSTTAWFYAPYADAPETSGLIIPPDTAAFRNALTAADSAGLHLMVHAIGDRANDWLLDVFASLPGSGGRDRRYRIEHAQHLRQAAISRFGPLGVIASMQPYHAADDGRWAEKRIGPVRIQTTYAFQSLLEARATLAFGSDWYVAPLDPILGIHAAVTRRTIDGANPQGWVPAQKITVAQALTAYTADNAYANLVDSTLGTVSVGKLADLVVLADDPLTIGPVSLDRIAVDLTVIGGEIVYRRDR